MKIYLLKILKKLHLINTDTFKEKYYVELIKKSKLFSKKHYMSQIMCADKTKNELISHYINIGWELGYTPSCSFNGNLYLEENQDVKKAHICPLVHYLVYGMKEGRKYKNINNKVISPPKYLSLYEKIKLFLVYPITVREEYIVLKSKYKKEKRYEKQ